MKIPYGIQYFLDAQACFAYIATVKKIKIPKTHPLPKKVMESADKKKPAAGWIAAVRKKLAALPPRIWTLGGAAVLVVAIGWWMFAPDQQEAPRTGLTPGPAGTGVSADGRSPASTGTRVAVNGRSPASAVRPGAGIPEHELIFIRSVRLKPSQPTRMDSLTAEVVAAPDAPERLTYIYEWRVNDQTLEGEKGDTLSLSPFKKGDLITVNVTPLDGEIYGHAVESPVVAVHGAQPTLELKAGRLARKAGEPVVLQLAGAAPDSAQITFSLEPPLVTGMTIDARTGRISWMPQPDQKGPVKFGASIVDDHQTKVTQVFEINLE